MKFRFSSIDPSPSLLPALAAAALLLVFATVDGRCDESQAAAHWSFEGDTAAVVADTASGLSDPISGNFRAVRGVVGQALKFDGYTTVVTRNASEAPQLPGPFTLEAWVALAAYPWSWCPVVSHSTETAGYALEIGPDGELAVKVFSGSAWRTCISQTRIPLRAWAHVAGVFDPETGLTVFIDGQEEGRLEFRGGMTPARRTDLVIGSVPQPSEPAYIHREHGTLPGWYSLDAILDEIEVHARILSAEELSQAVASLAPPAPPDIPERVLPSGPQGPGRFGAYYTRLEYHWEWDDLWRIDDDPDVVVQFDDSPVRVVFWRGTRYSPAWVTENNLWMADQSVEAWDNKEGCFEHMQDRHCRYSHVRIIETLALCPGQRLRQPLACRSPHRLGLLGGRILLLLSGPDRDPQIHLGEGIPGEAPPVPGIHPSDRARPGPGGRGQRTVCHDRKPRG